MFKRAPAEGGRRLWSKALKIDLMWVLKDFQLLICGSRSASNTEKSVTDASDSPVQESFQRDTNHDLQ
jgi:hypothetical protein